MIKDEWYKQLFEHLEVSKFRSSFHFQVNGGLDKVLENPQVIKTPVVRNGKQATLGYQPDVWKGWN